MDRRDAVKHVAVIMGGVLSASTLTALLDGCEHQPQYGSGTSFTDDEQQMVSEMADIIIPRTSTPGAIDAGVPAFIVMMMQECYPEKDQQAFHSGLKAFNDFCTTKYGHGFLGLSPENRFAAVQALDTRINGAKKKSPGGFGGRGRNGADDSPPDPMQFYRHMKELTLVGYFSSKPGATEALHYIPIPGRYDGCIPYHKGDKAWAT